MITLHLAAGLGTRLGSSVTKPLTTLANGETLLGRQVRLLKGALGEHYVPAIGVGYREELFREAWPDAEFFVSSRYASTNTAKTLLNGLVSFPNRPILWLNADVVFTEDVAHSVGLAIEDGMSFMAVQSGPVGLEEVKFRTDPSGFITAVGKGLNEVDGEAVGINFLTSDDASTLKLFLEDLDDNAYFEDGIQIALERGGLGLKALYLPNDSCIEVDFPSDLEKANQLDLRTSFDT